MIRGEVESKVWLFRKGKEQEQKLGDKRQNMSLEDINLEDEGWGSAEKRGSLVNTVGFKTS